MEKKEYTTPELTLLGDIEEITKGEGNKGGDDQFFRVFWAQADVTSG